MGFSDSGRDFYTLLGSRYGEPNEGLCFLGSFVLPFCQSDTLMGDSEMELSYMGGGEVLSPHLLLLDGDRSSTDLQPENIAVSSEFSRWLLVASRCFHSRGRHVPGLGRSGRFVQSSSIADNSLIYCRRERPGDKGAQRRTVKAAAPAVPVTLEWTLPFT